ncbi:hypothetical protein QMA10_11610 [Arthrobacter sp. APC 3897]|uniref:hypothetical protein n=1 Tax=Arthrobacter sp. APC 3897 TaxID=3035204 RepID=UPI0025B4F23E|nr:hypothetical protein [Arthrobacter sp. APC 3897]MDN3482567.1 hypothetical protein [Arthrobacter sp. APC 3897]
MTTPQSLLVVLRRWYLVLSGIVITGILCWAASQVVPPSYESRGSMVLMPPSAIVGDDGNPYLQLGGMSEALDVLVRQANAPEIRDQVLEEHPSATYTIEPDRSTSGSIVVVQATAETEEESLALLGRAMETLPAVLARMQDEISVTPHQRISIIPVVVDAEAALNMKQALQVLAVAVVLGLAGTFMVTALADGMLLSRVNAPQPPGTGPVPGGGSGPRTRVGPRGRLRRGHTPERAEPARPVPPAAPASVPARTGRRGTSPDMAAGEQARTR